MAMENDSTVTEFILTGLTDQPELQLPLFILFLVNYVITILGNLSLMSLIFLNSNLQTPMYFFLFNLSFIDLCYSFVFTPKTLMSFVSEKNTISFRGCMTQLFFFCFFANSECYVLTAMAYDRYVAICQPLLYMIIMSHRICSLMMLGSYLMGLAGAIVHTVFMTRLHFCNSNIINHYLCDISPLLQLSCSSTYANELVSSVVVSTVVIASSVIILMSYALILFNIIQLSSECYVLTVMAYDRYVAICQPLLYKVIMSPDICFTLMFGSYLMGFAGAMAHTGCMVRLRFCDSNIINHYMCDIFPLLQLSCSSTYVNELLSFVVVGTVISFSSLIILVSYARILSSFVQMSSGKGWSKAMGTCGSHIITVSLFYGSGLLAYVKPSSDETMSQGKIFSVFYTFLVPMLNPLIYSLRNKDVKLAVNRTMKRITNWYIYRGFS
ncbi:Olfactory receptor 143 [Microtus ochrogaster]|uniref:Olfactory receptor 143 n=1 Tax=Microtus ochrogaster TaxID=79684 RepID=A0A8J6GS66_MICOH|nr:Olfactory receptor 143 [Microtus ochrogaster]